MTEMSGYLFVLASACWTFAGYGSFVNDSPGWGIACLGLAIWQGYTAYRLFKEANNV